MTDNVLNMLNKDLKPLHHHQIPQNVYCYEKESVVTML